MAADRYTMILVPETHWDREWHQTFQQFRYRLVRLTDNLLDILDNIPEYKSFTFDGQTIVLEDYLEIRPEKRGAIEEDVRAGKLLIGPWYVLPDEWLVSGEALIRNLMIGHQIAAEFGAVMKAGYIPDPFGHISQLPQILQGFGIDSCFFMRGIGNEWDKLTTEFLWEAPDGTRVLAVHLMDGYCNATSLGRKSLWATEGEGIDMEAALAKVVAEKESLGPRASTRFLLLNNGCDHVEPQPELPEIIAYCNERMDDAEIVHGTYVEYIEAIKAENPELSVLSGEFHSGKYHPLLPGVFSARIHLKQANQRCQTLLEKYAEPLNGFAWLWGRPSESAFLWQAWKYVVSNHPHDSICGCSIDQVHREMMPRFEQAEQIGELIASQALDHIAASLLVPAPPGLQPGDQLSRAIIVFNPNGWARSECTTCSLSIPHLLATLPPGVKVLDSDGNETPAQVSAYRLTEHEAGFPREKGKLDIGVTFRAEVPPLGYSVYSLVRQKMLPEKPGERSLIVDRNAEGHIAIGNGVVTALVHPDGSFDLLYEIGDDKVIEFVALGALEDTEDAGDEYNYSPAVESSMVSSLGRAGTMTVIEDGPARATVRVDGELRLPASLSEDRLRRSDDTVACPFSTTISVQPGTTRVDVQTTFENNARDHRLRALFPMCIPDGEVFAESHFHVVKRPIELPEDTEDWTEQPSRTKATQGFVLVNDGNAGLAVVGAGLPEYEVLEEPGGCRTVALTLLRCVGWLSRDDYVTRPYHAGPKLPTPEAQCPGAHIFRYAIIPHIGSWEDAEVWRDAHNFVAPLRCATTPFRDSGRPAGRMSWISIEPTSLVVTAVKKAEADDALIVRLFNIASAEIDGCLTAGEKLASACLTNLNEEPLPDGELPVEDGCVCLKARPGQIVSLKLRFASE
jgi:mannosylglycerate hydrolase